ncbi:MAG: cytochrome c oxidase subunit 3 [Proteobacteria bacterium]|nr:cytochrome c oxidase subunit 3 [Pseudomonadota bacterium]
MSSQSGGYYLPAPSHWPIIGSIGLFLMAFGAALTMNAVSGGGYVLSAGALVMVYMLFGWFGTVIRESESGKFNKQVDVSFRWSMGWFIFSEVMFFACFFGALFYMRVLSIPWLAEGDTESLLWSGFSASWPTAGPGVASKFTPMGAWGLPAINTALLLTSGVTLTIAHWALLKGQRMKLHVFMFLTIVLGAAFLALQAEEYMHAYTELDLTLESGAYGATFYMLTGFHGFHVTIGTIMLIVIWLRGIRGHFKPEAHFGFEGVAWYWHFVDVVWLALFVLVYWL